MKKILLVLISVLLSLAIASPAMSWEVNIARNLSCEKTVKVSVDGEHLFWRQQDCEITLKPGQTGKCVLPGLICPVTVYLKDAETGAIEAQWGIGVAFCVNETYRIIGGLPGNKCGPSIVVD